MVRSVKLIWPAAPEHSPRTANLGSSYGPSPSDEDVAAAGSQFAVDRSSLYSQARRTGTATEQPATGPRRQGLIVPGPRCIPSAMNSVEIVVAPGIAAAES